MISRRVIIIGAGAAGLAAASRLIRNGHKNVLIFEASNRIGGRVHSVNVDYASVEKTEDELRHTIELGAEWIHGKVGNVSYEIASKEDLVEEESVEETMAGDFDETTFVCDVENDVTLNSDVMMSLIQKIVLRAETYEHDSTASYADFFNATFDQLLDGHDDDFKRKARVFKDFYHRLIRNIEGCSHWNHGSFVGSVVRYAACPGPALIPFKNEKKYLDLLQTFANDIPNDSIKLNYKVTKLRMGKPIRVEISGSNEIFEVDYVITTVSLGVLKADHESLFEPKLPKRKIEAIQKLGFGLVDKIFLEFDRLWWDPKVVRNGFAFLFDEAGDQAADFGYTEEDAERDWTRFLLGAYGVQNRPRILCFWISGEGAKKMESLTNDQVMTDCMATLRKFLGTKFGQIPYPVSIRISHWHSNPLTRGSYSYHTTEGEAASITSETLAEPVSNLLFAGEATHEKYFSTVHGAIETGYREADRILNQK